VTTGGEIELVVDDTVSGREESGDKCLEIYFAPRFLHFSHRQRLDSGCKDG
jgi:hypothetical protein